MQRRDNPYTPGAGRKPPYLAGRDDYLEEFGSLIEILSSGGADRSRIFYGLRGVGKTVLLSELDILASEAGGQRPMWSRSVPNPTFAPPSRRWQHGCYVR